MQIGIFSVGDVTTDPTTGRTPTEHERIKNTVAIAKHAEDVGLDVVALGQHHNPPFAASSPTTTLAYIAAQTERITLSTATTLITTNDPVKIAEDFAMLQHLADGRVDLVLGRGNTAPVYPWFGKNIQDGIELAIENYSLLRKLWDEDTVNWSGKFRTPLQNFTSTPRPLDGVAPFVWHGSIRTPQIAEMRGKPFPNDHLDLFFNATVDAAIVLAGLVQAAEAVGLGCCPISMIRDHAQTIAEMFGLPEKIVPVAGLTLGWPAEEGALSPRLPLSVTVHDTYDTKFLGLIGITHLDVTSSATAHLVRTLGGTAR